MKRDKIDRLVDVVCDLLRDGEDAPNDRQIARAFSGEEYPPASVEDFVKDHMADIRDGLRLRGFSDAHCVSWRFYSHYKFKDRIPETSEEASRCIPGGRSNPARGVRIVPRAVTHDLILAAAIERQERVGVGIKNGAEDRARDGVEAGYLDAGSMPQIPFVSLGKTAIVDGD